MKIKGLIKLKYGPWFSRALSSLITASKLFIMFDIINKLILICIYFKMEWKKLEGYSSYEISNTGLVNIKTDNIIKGC